MIRPKAALHSILFSTLTAALLLCFAFPDGAGAFDVGALRTLRNRNLKQQHFSTQALMTFNVPLQISDLPPAFLGGRIIVDCIAYYRSGNQFGGIVFGRSVREGLIGGGSYQGTVSVPGEELMGMISGSPEGACIAMVEKGDSCMALGAGCSGGDCGDLGELAFISDCSENIFQQIYQGGGPGGGGGAVLR